MSVMSRQALWSSTTESVSLTCRSELPWNTSDPRPHWTSQVGGERRVSGRLGECESRGRGVGVTGSTQWSLRRRLIQRWSARPVRRTELPVPGHTRHNSLHKRVHVQSLDSPVDSLPVPSCGVPTYATPVDSPSVPSCGLPARVTL